METSETLEQELGSAVDAIAGDAPEIAPAATAANLVDVAYAVHDSPAGTRLLAATPRGLVRVAYIDSSEQAEVLEQWRGACRPSSACSAPAGRGSPPAGGVLHRQAQDLRATNRQSIGSSKVLRLPVKYSSSWRRSSSSPRGASRTRGENAPRQLLEHLRLFGAVDIRDPHETARRRRQQQHPRGRIVYGVCDVDQVGGHRSGRHLGRIHRRSRRPRSLARVPKSHSFISCVPL